MAKAVSNLDHYDEAEKSLEEGLLLTREISDLRQSIVFLGRIAFVSQKQHRPENSGRLSGPVAALQTDIALAKASWASTDFGDAVPAARKELGEKTFAALWAEGQAMSLDEAAKCALEP